MWHVSSRSGVASLRTAIHLLLTYLLTRGKRLRNGRVSVCLSRRSTAAAAAGGFDAEVGRGQNAANK